VIAFDGSVTQSSGTGHKVVQLPSGQLLQLHDVGEVASMPFTIVSLVQLFKLGWIFHMSSLCDMVLRHAVHGTISVCVADNVLWLGQPPAGSVSSSPALASMVVRTCFVLRALHTAQSTTSVAAVASATLQVVTTTPVVLTTPNVDISTSSGYDRSSAVSTVLRVLRILRALGNRPGTSAATPRVNGIPTVDISTSSERNRLSSVSTVIRVLRILRALGNRPVLPAVVQVPSRVMGAVAAVLRVLRQVASAQPTGPSDGPGVSHRIGRTRVPGAQLPSALHSICLHSSDDMMQFQQHTAPFCGTVPRKYWRLGCTCLICIQANAQRPPVGHGDLPESSCRCSATGGVP